MHFVSCLAERAQMNEAPFSDPSIVYNPLWYPLVAELLGGTPRYGEGGACLLYSCGASRIFASRFDDRPCTPAL